MNNCEDCIHYKDGDFLTGYCVLNNEIVLFDDECKEFSENKNKETKE